VVGKSGTQRSDDKYLEVGVDVGVRFASISVCKINLHNNSLATQRRSEKAFGKVRNVANLSFLYHTVMQC